MQAKYIYLPVIDSTNNELKRRAEEAVEDFTVISARLAARFVLASSCALAARIPKAAITAIKIVFLIIFPIFYF